MKVGDCVRLIGGTECAHILLFYTDIEGGVRLDKKIGGFYSWNIFDLELVRIA